jgi:hypothetical protein
MFVYNFCWQTIIYLDKNIYQITLARLQTPGTFPWHPTAWLTKTLPSLNVLEQNRNHSLFLTTRERGQVSLRSRQDVSAFPRLLKFFHSSTHLTSAFVVTGCETKCVTQIVNGDSYTAMQQRKSMKTQCFCQNITAATAIKAGADSQMLPHPHHQIEQTMAV